MMPEFIKKEDKEKEKEINDINKKIPLGFVVMCNNNKIINELKNFYSKQNMNMNFNIMNNINNMNSSNLINNNNNVDNVTKIINDIKNSKSSQKNIPQKETLNYSNIINKDNKDNKDVLLNNNNNFDSTKIETNDFLPKFNFFQNNNNNSEKIGKKENINKEIKLDNKNLIVEKKEKLIRKKQ